MNDKWQQCLKTLAEKRPEFALAEDGYFYWGENDGGGFANHWFATSLSQDDIDEIAALLGKRIYVFADYSGKLCVNVRTLDNGNLDLWVTDQTDKLEATKVGLMSIVEKVK